MGIIFAERGKGKKAIGGGMRTSGLSAGGGMGMKKPATKPPVLQKKANTGMRKSGVVLWGERGKKGY